MSSQRGVFAKPTGRAKQLNGYIRLTVDRLAALVAAPNPTAPLAGLWPLLLLIALPWLLGQTLTSLIRWTRAAQTERVQDHLHALIHDQATRLDLAYYEQPEVLQSLK
ncbi:MAG: hypothetical protein WAV07_00035 [Candidatus Contendobacter sp.]